MTSNILRGARRVAVWKWLTVFVAGTLLLGLFVADFRYHAWDFRNNLWAPARLLLQGDMPYDAEALARLSSELGLPLHLSIWFPTILGIGLPLGAMALPNAANIWLVLSLVASLVAVGLIHSLSRPEDSPRSVLSLAAIVLVFTPSYAHFWLGQAALVVLASVVASWVLLDRERPGWAGLVLSLSWVKPQLVLFVWPLLGWRAIEKGQWRAVLIGWLGGSLAQTLPLWILDPTWPAGYLDALGANPAWLQPNLRSLVGYWSGSQVLSWMVTLLVVAAAGIWLAWMWRRSNRLGVFAWTLALTTVLGPYTWSYDHVLLLPFLVVALDGAKSGRRRAMFWIVFVACQVVYMALRLCVVPEAWYVLFPPVLMTLGAWLTRAPSEPHYVTAV